MGNTLKGLVENGQPQGLGNKVVTYNGLIDFLEMLKDEIPRMGFNNTIRGTSSYSFGTNNKGEGLESFLIGNSNHVFGSRGFTFGYENHLGKKTDSQITYSHNVAIGESNKLSSSWVTAIGKNNETKDLPGEMLYATMIGFNNHIEANGKYNFIVGQHNYSYQDNACLFGQYLKSATQGQDTSTSAFAMWIGQYNDPVEDVVFGIGNGTEDEKRSNLFSITKSGVIYMSCGGIFNTNIEFLGSVSSSSFGGSNILMQNGMLTHFLRGARLNTQDWDAVWCISDDGSASEPEDLHINRIEGFEQDDLLPKTIHMHTPMTFVETCHGSKGFSIYGQGARQAEEFQVSYDQQEDEWPTKIFNIPNHTSTAGLYALHLEWTDPASTVPDTYDNHLDTFIEITHSQSSVVTGPNGFEIAFQYLGNGDIQLSTTCVNTTHTWKIKYEIWHLFNII